LRGGDAIEFAAANPAFFPDLTETNNAKIQASARMEASTAFGKKEADVTCDKGEIVTFFESCFLLLFLDMLGCPV